MAADWQDVSYSDTVALEALRREAAAASTGVAALREEIGAEKAALSTLQSELSDARAYEATLSAQTAKTSLALESRTSPAQKQQLDELIRLLELESELAESETRFRTDCHATLASLRAEAALWAKFGKRAYDAPSTTSGSAGREVQRGASAEESQGSDGFEAAREKQRSLEGLRNQQGLRSASAGDAAQRLEALAAAMAQVEAAYEEERQRHRRLVAYSAAQKRALAAARRRAEETPTLPELAQYALRLDELWRLRAERRKGVEKLQTKLAAAEATRVLLSKEVGVLNSIAETFDDAFENRASRDEFVRQLESIVKGVEISLAAKRTQVRERETQLRHKATDHRQHSEERTMLREALRELQEEAVRQRDLLARRPSGND